MTVNAPAAVCRQMQRQTYSAEERAQALELLATVGLAEAVRITGIAKGTISSWGHRAGVEGASGSSATADARAVAAAVKAVTIAERKTALAEALMGDAERMRQALFAATTERKAFGATRFTDSEVVTIRNPTTTATERKVTIEAIAKAIETVNLLTGEATQRIEQLGAGDGTPAPERAKAEETVLQLVQGSAA